MWWYQQGHPEAPAIVKILSYCMASTYRKEFVVHPQSVSSSNLCLCYGLNFEL